MEHTYALIELAQRLNVTVAHVRLAATELGLRDVLRATYTEHQAQLIRRFLLQYLAPRSIPALHEWQAEGYA